jgi:hypothetical protein
MISSSSRIGARAGVFSLVAMLCMSVACDDTSDDMTEGGTAETTGDGDGDPGDGDGDPGALSYAADIQPIWDDKCASCHSPTGFAQLFVDLSGDSYSNVVGVLSTQAPDKQFIEAGNAANSYLIAKLRNTQEAAGGSGGLMPGGVMPMALPEETIVLIEQWADGGALP